MVILPLHWQTVKIMIREKEINQAAKEYTDNYGYLNVDLDDVSCGFMDGAEWADEHPKSPWHSVKDGELPQEAKDCIFSYQGELYKGFMFDDKSLHFDDEFSPTLDININEVDYWMEIPKLPTE